MSQWSDTDVHGPEQCMKYMREGKPSYLPGRPIFHSHKDGRGKTGPLSEVEAKKRFDDMESHILFLAAKIDFCADNIEEWRPEWNPVTTIGPGKTNDDPIKQFFDAGQGNLVIMDMSEHHENITEAERIDLLGDWEATRSGGKIRKHKNLKDPDESKSRQLKLVSLDHVRLCLEYIEPKTFLTAFQSNDPMKIEAARKVRLVQAYLTKGRKRARELAEMDIDPNAQVARLHCANLFDLDYHHH
eukprot:jgi/Tetstr1/437781/TSEL_026435.t1